MIVRRGNGMNTGLGIVILVALVLSWSPHLLANDFRNDHVALYGPCGPNVAQLVASRYDMGTSGRAADMNIIRQIKPDFLWFYYISIEDAASGDRKAYIDNLAAQNGIDPETFHMHYWNYTEVILQGDTLICPGLANATTRQDTIDSRVPIYYSNRARTLNNLYSSPLRQFEKMWACEVLSTLPSNFGVTSTVGYYDGIFWDNGSWCLYNTGQRITGGQIAEHPPHAQLEDVSCNGSRWWWESCLKPFYQDLVDTLNQSPNWHPDGKPKYSKPNMTRTWTDDYVLAGTAHYLAPEFVPRWDMRNSLIVAYSTRDSLAHANGLTFQWSSSLTTELGGYEGSYTHDEAIVNNLSLFYVFGSPSASLYHLPHASFNPSLPGWDTLSWAGAMDYDVGDPLQSRYQLVEQGTDGRGYTYYIYSRQYQNAKVYSRTRGNYNEHFDQLTNVTLQLGGTYRELRPDGSFGNTVSSIGFRNGQGRIMIPFASDDSIPPGPVDDLGSDVGSIPGSILLGWTETGDDGLSGVASFTVIRYSLNAITGNNWAQASPVSSPPVPSTPGVNVQFEIQNLTPGQFYYVALQTYDDAGRSSGLATASSFARGVKRPIPLFTNIDTVDAEVEVGCSSVDSYLTLRYEFALGTVNRFPDVSNRSPTFQLSDTSALFDNLVDGVQYYWSCRAMDIGGTDSSIWSAVTNFTLDGGIIVSNLTVAELISPQEGDTVLQSQTSFSVDYIPGLTTVYLQIDDDPIFGSPLESGSLPVTAGNATVWQAAIETDTSGTYYWRASADDLTWTESVSFYLLHGTLALEAAPEINPHPFPNPFNLNTVDHVTFTDMPMNSTLNIYTLLGYRIRQLTSKTGEDIIWYGRNNDGKPMATAVYLWHIEGTNYNGKFALVR